MFLEKKNDRNVCLVILNNNNYQFPKRNNLYQNLFIIKKKPQHYLTCLDGLVNRMGSVSLCKRNREIMGIDDQAKKKKNNSFKHFTKNFHEIFYKKSCGNLAQHFSAHFTQQVRKNE